MKTESIPEFIADDLTTADNFNIIVSECKFGYFYTFRTVWRFRTHGGEWYSVSLFIILQLFCTFPALIIDLVGILLFHIALLLWGFIKRFLNVVLIVIGAALGLFLIYFFIATGLWRNLFNFLASLI